MGIRQGTLLEREVERILRHSGFNTSLNKRISGYEIDVFVSYKGRKIGFECKQYAKSPIPIRNLILLWSKKKEILGFDKLVLVIFGHKVTAEQKKLAKKEGIVLWDTDKLEHYQELGGSKFTREQILYDLNISTSVIDIITLKLSQFALTKTFLLITFFYLWFLFKFDIYTDVIKIIFLLFILVIVRYLAVKKAKNTRGDKIEPEEDVSQETTFEEEVKKLEKENEVTSKKTPPHIRRHHKHRKHGHRNHRRHKHKRHHHKGHRRR